MTKLVIGTLALSVIVSSTMSLTSYISKRDMCKEAFNNVFQKCAEKNSEEYRAVCGVGAYMSVLTNIPSCSDIEFIDEETNNMVEGE